MINNVLITGGAGFLGSALTLRLKSKGFRVTVLDNLSRQIHGEGRDSYLYGSIKGKVKFIKGDIRDPEDCFQALRSQDAVVHMAAETGTGQSMYEVEKYFDVNVNGTAVLLDAIKKKGSRVKKIVLASSRAVYGEGKYKCSRHGVVYPISRYEQDLGKGDFHIKCPVCHQNVDPELTDENSRIHPVSIYGLTKQIQEQMVEVSGRTMNIPVAILRYQNVYGPGQSLSNPYTGILSIFSTRMKNQNDINIFEDGQESRDFVYLDDAIQATVKAIQKEKIAGVFNVGSGIATSVLVVAQTLKDIYGSDVKINVSGHYRLGDIRHNLADLKAAKEKLGFVPRYSFKEGIRRFADWVNAQKVMKDNYENSIEEMRKKGLYR
ncbi:MAG: SDR family NAD(P)-dependent oxidoreductase [Spirochaetes bacterium]|nr:SDR family NAD(P)-dependent oxidoreductase [Spirochaetota bacterium]